MKKALIIFSILAISNLTFAQSITHSLTAGIQSGRTLHGIVNGTGPNLQYDVAFNRLITLSASTGLLTGTKNYSDAGYRYFGEDRIDHVTEYYIKEGHMNFDLSLLFLLTNSDNKYALRAGLGTSFILNRIEFPDEMVFDRGVLIEGNYSTSNYIAKMANVIIENEYKFSKHFSIQFRGIFRTSFEKKNLIISKTEMLSEGGGEYSPSIQFNGGLVLGLKYTF